LGFRLGDAVTADHFGHFFLINLPTLPKNRRSTQLHLDALENGFLLAQTCPSEIRRARITIGAPRCGGFKKR
jgi:hypothetical protein